MTKASEDSVEEVQVVSARSHGVDDEFFAAVEAQGGTFEKAPGGVETEA